MKILIITSRVPYPPNRGDKLRIYNIIKGFAEKNEVKVLSFVKDECDRINLERLREEGIDIETIFLSKLKSVLNLFRCFVSYDPFQVLYYRSKKMYDKISKITSTKNYDVIYFHLFLTAQYHKTVAASSAVKVLDFTDAASLYLKRFLEFQKAGLKKFYFLLDLKRIFRYELMAENFDTVFVCSPVDKNYFMERKVKADIKLFINGIDANRFKYEKYNPEKFRIIFTGNMPYFPNQDAVLYFVKEIFPLILQKNPDAIFYIVGNGPTREILALQNKNIVVTGLVEDIRKEYLNSVVNVAPVRFGAGTPNKIIEAMALGIPTVATSLTISGFDDQIKKYIFVADNPEQFANHVINIFNDESVRHKIMKEASELVFNLFDGKKVIGEIEQYLTEKIAMKQNNQV